MITISATGGGGNMSPYAKRLVAASMYNKGKHFIAAAILLRQKGGYEYVVLHLLCQGIEITLKSFLLFLDYDKFQPKLRRYGHDLIKVASDVLLALKLHPLKKPLEVEFNSLSALYSDQRLRYGTGYDIFVDPNSIKSDLVMRRVAATLRLAERTLLRNSETRAAFTQATA